MDDQAVLRLDVAGPALALHEAEHPALRDHLARGAYGQLDGMADPPGRHAHLTMKVIGIGVAHPVRDPRNLGEQQSVQGPAGGDVQCVTDVEQPLVRVTQTLVRPVGQPGRGQRPQHDHVPEAAARLLEIGLQQVGRVAERLVPFREG